jgi:hypothetical protein
MPRRRFGGRDREHLSADLEDQVVAPLDLFGRARIGEAMLAELFESHDRVIIRDSGYPTRTLPSKNPRAAVRVQV